MTHPSQPEPALAEPSLDEAPALALAADFAPATDEEWVRLAAGVLRKTDPDLPVEKVTEVLGTVTYDGITLAPLYTRESAAPATGLPGQAPFTRGASAAGSVPAGWDVRQRHADPDPAATQEAILADLENGVTSLWLTLGPAGLPVDALSTALDGVYLDLAPVVLDAGAQTSAAATAYLDLLAARGVDPAQARGNLGADPIGRAAREGTGIDDTDLRALAVRCVRGYPELRAGTVDATGYHDAGGSDAQELAFSIATGVAYLRALTGAGLGVTEAFGQLEFRYAASVDQFATVAKLRAARRLWARVAQECGVPEAGAQRQHAVTSSAMMTVRDPWVNMLRVTVACVAAAVGGADAITVQPFDSCLGLPDSFARRIARNTQAVLLDECGVGRVLDPAGGSWYVEERTEALARAAWKLFTEVERFGGMARAVQSGWVAQRLDETWQRRADELAHRRDPITGVSEYPHLEEVLPTRRPAAEGDTPPPAGALPRHRYAEQFEALRARADAATAKQGVRPSVFLATLGPLAAHTARAGFAANLFAAAGIATTRSGPVDDPAELAALFAASGADLACVCGSDRSYAEHAGAVTTALATTGRPVWLAGRPAQYPGVFGYLYSGVNAIDVLTTALDQLDA
jgi:methylmalonyl-CoA mutase